MSTRVSVFLVEDETLIRFMTAEMVEELGHRVVAEAGSIEEGLPFAKSANFDLALLDINIAGDSIAPIAEILERRRLPFLFVSGYKKSGLPEPLDKKPLLQKPFQITQLKQAIEGVLRPDSDQAGR